MDSLASGFLGFGVLGLRPGTLRDRMDEVFLERTEMLAERVILHADMDAFFAAIEQRDRPELRGRPVIVGGPGPRGVVATASYEARSFGVGSAMPMSVARRRCPEGIIVPPRFDAYAAASRKVREVFDRFSPLVEPLSIDEAFLDLTGTRSLLGAPADVARRIREEVREATGLAVSVGVAPCKYVAKVASDIAKPDGLLVVPAEEVLAFLAPLPVSRLWGVGPKTEPRLRELGLETLGQVAACDQALLESRLGSLGTHIHALARGDDPRAVIPEHEARSMGWERTLDEDVSGEAAIMPHLRRSADEVARRLRKDGLRASGVRIKLKSRDFFLHSRQARLAVPADSAEDLLATAERLLAEVDLSLSFRLIGLAGFDLSSSRTPVQGDLFLTRTRERRSELDRTLDAIDARFGHGAVRRASEAKTGGRSTLETDGEAEEASRQTSGRKRKGGGSGDDER